MGNNPITMTDPDGGCTSCLQNFDWDGLAFASIGSQMFGSFDVWQSSSLDIIDLGDVSKPFNIIDWMSNHIYFNAEAGMDFGTQAGVNIKALGGKVTANYKKDVNPLIKLGVNHDKGWEFTSIPNGPNSGYGSDNESNEWNIGGLVGVGKEYTKSKGFYLGNGEVKSETSDSIIISITEEYHTSGVHRGKVKNRKFGWGVGADLSLLLGFNFNISGGFQFETKNN